MSLKCAYHPERDAGDKCENCNKVICLECKMVYHETVHHGTGDSSYAYSRRYELCPPCYYDRKIRTHGHRNIIGGIVGIVFTIVFISISQSLFVSEEGIPSSFNIYRTLFLLIPILIIIFIIASVFIYGPIKVKDFKSKREEFFNRLQPSASIQKEKTTPNFCIECGNRIDPDAVICSYCGATAKKKV